MKKVVVIGGAGFIGSHTADELSERGYRVTILDRSESPWLREDQEFVQGEIHDTSLLRSTLEGANYVYHFAGIADIREASQNPYETINTNVMGTVLLLDAVRDAKVEKLIYASTMYVYSPHGSFYRASKQAAEILIEAYHNAYGMEYILLRYGSLYGPRAQNWNGLRGYVKQIIKEGRLEYDGSGRERREYIHVQDAARLSVDILDQPPSTDAITVTGIQVMTSKEILEMIFEIVGREPKIDYVERQKHDYHYTLTPYSYAPKKAKKLVPSEFIDLGQGILEIVEEENLEFQNTEH